MDKLRVGILGLGRGLTHLKSFLAIEEGNPRYLGYIPAMAKETQRALDQLGDTRLSAILADRSEYFG